MKCKHVLYVSWETSSIVEQLSKEDHYLVFLIGPGLP